MGPGRAGASWFLKHSVQLGIQFYCCHLVRWQTYLGLLPIGTAPFTIAKKKQKLGEKPAFHVQKLLQFGGFPSYFPTDFLVKPSVHRWCPWRLASFCCWHRQGSLKQFFFAQIKRKGVPPKRWNFVWGIFQGNEQKKSPVMWGILFQKTHGKCQGNDRRWQRPGNPKVMSRPHGFTFQATGLTFQTEDARPTTKVRWWGGVKIFGSKDLWGGSNKRRWKV